LVAAVVAAISRTIVLAVAAVAVDEYLREIV
jgi:hypothetical protein